MPNRVIEGNYIAVDLGAESGRVMLGTLDFASATPRLALRECHRFANVPVMRDGGLRWNIEQLWTDIRVGVAKAVEATRAAGGVVHGISADSWGVDYVLLGGHGEPIAPPHSYRDRRSRPPFDRLLREIGAADIFAQTGIQLMSINTLYQLAAEPRASLEAATTLLPIADYINHLIAGSPTPPRVERSMASTTQAYDVTRNEWADGLIDHVGISRRLFPSVVASGTLLGGSSLVPSPAQVIATCSHDTACAVAAVPAENDDRWAYLSSGTWSLLGLELADPLVNEACRAAGYSNELGAFGTTRLLKNLSGLYILQQCREAWKAANTELDYAALNDLAAVAEPLRSLIRPDDACFAQPGDMPANIVEYCQQTNQPAPRSPGEFARCIFESLALLYRESLAQLRKLTGRPINRLHVVGGGSRAALLNQLTADACELPVIAGPVEATAMGNALLQAVALGHLDARDVRRVVRNSTTTERFSPRSNAKIFAAANRFAALATRPADTLHASTHDTPSPRERKSLMSYSYVNDLWDDDAAAKLDAVGRLVYRSNLLGADRRITNTGGGNTSSKIRQRDPLTGEEVDVLWVKGSGGDLRTSKRENFSSLYQSKLVSLQNLYASRSDKGLKSPAEDDMVGMYAHTTFNLNPRPSSIDTPLHSFVPGRHVDHMHPNAIIAIAASKNCERLTREIFDGEMAYVPWMRPGFELGLAMEEIVGKAPSTRAIMMGQHGFIAWDDDDRKCYMQTLDFIERASAFIEQKYQANGGDAAAFGGAKYKTLDEAKRNEVFAAILPWLRGQVSRQMRMIGTVQCDDRILRYVNSNDAPQLSELGTSCPDHFLRTKIKPLYVAWDPQTGDIASLKTLLAAGLDAYRADYAQYYDRCKRADSPAMRDPNPTVVLIPGLGMIAWGKDKSESRVTAEFFNCAIEVMRGAEAIDEYVALPQQEAFDIEYWALEEAKLQRMPAEKELARQVHVVIGAGSGIGKEVTHRLAREGAHIVAVDLNANAAMTTAKEIEAKYGLGIGVAGTGVSTCGPALGLAANITDRASIRAMLDQAALAYGGFDSIEVTAGIFVPSDTTGHIPDDKWALTFNINVTGSYLVADEAHKTWKEQGLKGNLVLTTSANAVVGKKGSLAYDTSKAAANHLVRELAIELAPLVRVNGVAPATVVQGSAMFPRDRVIGSLAKYSIAYTDDEATESLVAKLAQFYADRTLTRSPITPADQAEAYFLWVSNRLSKTTGQILTVDGGLHEAFLR